MIRINKEWELILDNHCYILRQTKVDHRKVIKRKGDEIPNPRYNMAYIANEIYPTSWSRIVKILIEEKIKESDFADLSMILQKIDSLCVDELTDNTINAMRKTIVSLENEVARLKKKVKE